MSGDHSTTTKKKDSIYRIEICQDGKFAVTFDTENLRIKILENTDHRQFILYNDSNNKNNKDESDESDEIAKTIAYFKINNDFDIDKFYDIDYTPPPFVESLYSSNSKDDEYIDYTPPPFVGSLDSSNSKDDDKDNTSPPSVGSLEKEFRWSFDISNMYKKSDDKDFKYFVLVAVSRIKVDEDMKGEVNNNNEDNYKKGNLSEKKFEYRLEDKDTATIDIEKELDDRKKGIAISKKEFKCELENEDTKFDTTIDVEEHKSEELDDRTSELKNEPKKGIAIYRLEFEDIKMKEGMEEIKDNEKEKKKNYVLKAVTRYYYNNISGICSFVEEAPDEDEKDKDEDKNDKDEDKKDKDEDKKDKDEDKNDKDEDKKDKDEDKKDKDEDKNDKDEDKNDKDEDKNDKDEDKNDKDEDKNDKDEDKNDKDEDKNDKDEDKNDKDEDKNDKDEDKNDKDEDKNELKKFIILNFRGIYNFKFDDHFNFFNLDEKFEYPRSIRRELDNWYTAKTDNDCMKRLFSCIYNKYFLVTQYTNNVQSLEVYDLEKMTLETTAKSVENKDKFINQYYYDTFSVGKIQLCFTRGINNVKLYYMENGLQIISKEFDEIEKIHLLEFIDSDEKILIIGEREKELKFIVWDLYSTGKAEKLPNFVDNSTITMKNLSTCLARTSGNILQIDDDGKVSSVLKKVENELKKTKKEKNKKLYHKEGIISKKHKKQSHYIYYDKNKNEDFKPIVSDKELWVLGDYERNSYCLYQNKEGSEIETLQLIVGRTTVQIWHQIQDDKKNKDELPNKGEPFLEYIWTNRIPVNQERKETRLRIENFEYGTNLHDKLIDFSLKVYWYIRVDKDNEESVKKKKGENDIIREDDKKIDEMEKKKMKENGNIRKWEKKIKRKFIIKKSHTVRHACKALEHLNKRYKHRNLANNYIVTHEYEEMISYIKHIVWRFVKYEPENFKLLDVRNNVMKSLILSDCNHLIKFILFGDEEIMEDKNGYNEKGKKVKNLVRHIPSNTLWPGKIFLYDDDLNFDETEDELKDKEKIKPKNIMELAIYNCNGRELKDTIVVAYLLEYYSRYATDCAGWMCTVSKAIPLLFKYNYDDYARKLFFKECFADHDHFSGQDPDEIIPTEYKARRNHNIKFRAFRPIDEMKSDKYKPYYKIMDKLNSFKNKIAEKFEDFDNNLGKSPIALRVVPLPSFTINEINENPKKKVNYDSRKIILNILWFIFIPRWYKIGRDEKDKLSPFSRMILYENNDDIYDNPATEAIIDFRWREAVNFILSLFIRFLIYFFCFGLVSWAYVNHSTIINGKFLFALIIVFYYLAIYQFVVEMLQISYRGPRKYLGEIFNSFDMISIVLSVTVMSIMLKDFTFSDGFGGINEADTRLIVGISFSIFFLWFESILYLRILSNIGIYIYFVIIIFKSIFPLLLFMLIVILAFAHTMFVLLSNPRNIETKDSIYSGNVTNPSTNETLNISFKSKSNDNPFSTYYTAMMTTYLWLYGDWVQRDDFNFWAVDVFTLVASLFLIIVLQNMLIAFMSGVYEEAKIKGRQTLLRHRAIIIADYEALHHIHYWNHEPDPKHIYYFGQSKTIEEWYDSRKHDRGAIYKGFEEKSTFTKYIFKERNYDKHSIWVYEDNIESEIEKIKIMKNDLNDKIENLITKLNEKKKNNNEINIGKLEILKNLELK
ncbi:unnamed protein product [Rhizophagus irregularis]|uniref:Ion transport domain-containing protein n=1 Tax=Rhizophagus irregularis TaxID=588596 RepID=A0A915Z4D9_9GLOM|nr:unnamed protein product [Rhizophagus irregularis]